jgi:hypothetical protein
MNRKNIGNTSKQEGIQGNLGGALNTRKVHLIRYSRTPGGTEKPNSGRADFLYSAVPWFSLIRGLSQTGLKLRD